MEILRYIYSNRYQDNMTINPTFTFLKQNIHIGNQGDNINQYLQNKLHGPMHYKIGDTGVFNGHVYILLLQHDKSNPPISKFSRPCNEFTGVWSMFPCNKTN